VTLLINCKQQLLLLCIQLNFFLINESFYFVDLPGYGFAKVSKKMREGWGKMAEEYLASRPQLALSIQLVDSRHKPTTLDTQLHEWLVFHEKPHLIAATKADKVSRSQLPRSLKEIGTALPSEIIAYSSETGLGREALWAEIQAAIKKSANNS